MCITVQDTWFLMLATKRNSDDSSAFLVPTTLEAHWKKCGLNRMLVASPASLVLVFVSWCCENWGYILLL